MGPLGDIGPYAGTVITTQKVDVEPATDKPPDFSDMLIGLLMLPLGYGSVMFIGLYMWTYRLPLCLIGLLVLGLWACTHFGSSKPLIRWRKKR